NHRRRARKGQEPVACAAGVRERQHHEHRASARLLRDDCELAAISDRRAADRRGDARAGCHRRGRALCGIEPHDRLVRAVIVQGCSMTQFDAGPAETGLHIRGLSPTRDVLANGVTILTKQTSTTPAVTLHASLLAAGSTSDPSPSAGLAHFVSRTIDRGTSGHSADENAQELDGRGVSLSVTVGRHALSLVATCLVEDFDPILSLLAEIVTTPTFPPAEVDRRRGEIVTMIRQDEDNPAAVASDGLMAMLYGQ